VAVNPIPEGYPRLSPYLAVDGATDAIAFYCDVLGFESRGGVMTGPDGRVGHAELALGSSVLMLSDEAPEAGALSPRSLGGSPVLLHLYVEDVDALFAKAVEAGATVEREPSDQFYGDRMAVIADPWGHRWSMSSHIEDVSMEEMERRATEAMSEG